VSRRRAARYNEDQKSKGAGGLAWIHDLRGAMPACREDQRDVAIDLRVRSAAPHHQGVQSGVSRSRNGDLRQSPERDTMVDVSTFNCENVHHEGTTDARAAPVEGAGHGAHDEPEVTKSLWRENALRDGRLILVAEDNETNQKVILQQLRLLGVAADLAGDGLDALQRWNITPYALLLTDLHMPKLDGCGLAQAIRAAEPVGRRMPIVALTANAIRQEADQCRLAGMDDYVSKPIPLSSLKVVLDRWIPAVPAAANCLDTTARLSQSPASAALSVDISVLRNLVGDDPVVLREVLRDFRASAERTAGDLRAACAAGHAMVAGAAAHKLKSSARAVGALALGALCADIERAGNAGDHMALAERRPAFDAEIDAVDASISRLLVVDTDALRP
jgi:CheY-like chemotaxis protein/HPt (histidine-containing phosphotransfer) domain-containing protein